MLSAAWTEIEQYFLGIHGRRQSRVYGMSLQGDATAEIWWMTFHKLNPFMLWFFFFYARLCMQGKGYLFSSNSPSYLDSGHTRHVFFPSCKDWDSKCWSATWNPVSFESHLINRAVTTALYTLNQFFYETLLASVLLLVNLGCLHVHSNRGWPIIFLSCTIPTQFWYKGYIRITK